MLMRRLRLGRLRGSGGDEGEGRGGGKKNGLHVVIS
jgi:hypothetical protein